MSASGGGHGAVLKYALIESYVSRAARISSTSNWSMQFSASVRRSGSLPSSSCTSTWRMSAIS